MSFVQAEFLVFFAVLFVAYWGLPGRWQNITLVLGSAVFYGWVHPAFLVVLLGSALLDYAMARGITEAPQLRRTWLALSVLGNIGVLVYFKYVDFFVVEVREALATLGLEAPLHTVGVVVPLGLSFYTFQTLGYTVDVYRGRVASRRLLDVLTFVMFFPQLVSGPIERAARLMPQLERPRGFDPMQVRSGLGLALWGGFQKVVVADTLAPYVDKAFLLRDPGGPILWAGAAAFMLQVYADLSGYTDLARGISRMLGIELVRNFDRPWRAMSTPEFWNRWHTSMTHWVRDMVLVPLVGPGPTPRWRWALAVVLTFLLIGAWHGAGWNFLVFGLFHAVCMLAFGLAQPWLRRLARADPVWQVLAAGVHLGTVGLVGALIFREPEVGRLAGHFTGPMWSAGLDAWVGGGAIIGVMTGGVLVLAVGRSLGRVQRRLRDSPWLLPLQTSCWTVCVLAIAVFTRSTAQDFLYFAF